MRGLRIVGLFMAVGVPFAYYGNYKAAVSFLYNFIYSLKMRFCNTFYVH